MTGQGVLAPDDLALLRAHEPVLRYNRGELFYPMAVEGYLAECDVLAGTGEKDRRVLVPRGEVTPERLAAATPGPGESLYLRFVQEPLGQIELARWQRRPDRSDFRTPGRLARVGLFARLVDAGFTASLLARGTVPGGTAAAASVKYEAIRAGDDRCVYHARVLRRDGWIVLHYVFFYAMNDWRSTFLGANDHEADWEQLFVFLDDAPGGPVPAWVACAAHDYTGDDLRRRWDDPTLAKDGTHPLINPGGGSHAAYFEQGDYLTAAPVPGLSRPAGAARRPAQLLAQHPSAARSRRPRREAGGLPQRRVHRLWPGQRAGRRARRGGRVDAGPDRRLGRLGRRVPRALRPRHLRPLRRRAGPGRPEVQPQRHGAADLVRPARMGWVGQGRPAQPRPRGARGTDRRALGRDDRPRRRDRGRRAGPPHQALEIRSLADEPSLASLRNRGVAALAEAESAQAARRRKKVDLAETARAAREELARIRTGDWGDPRSHLQHEHHPIPAEETRYGILIEVWSAISVSLLLIATVALIYLGILSVWVAIIVVIAAYALVEAAFQRRLTTLLLRLTLLLAVIGAIVLAVTYAVQALVVLLIALAAIILLDNVRELRGR